MKILVTGGRGQLGQSLKKIEDLYTGHTFVFTDMPEADITDREAIKSLVNDNNIDVIINCAAYTAVDKAEADEAAARQINVEGPRVLAETAKENGIPLVHISTDYVFAGDGNSPLKETDEVGPTGIYGRTKLEGEKVIEDSGCDAVVIRTSWLYSEFGGNFVKTMLRLGKEREELNVVYDQTGTPTYARDLAEAAVWIAENGIEGFDIYHYSNEGVTSWFDFAKMIFKIAGMDVKVNPVETSAYPTAAKRPAYSVLSKDKAKEAGVSVPYWTDSLAICIANLNE